MRRSTEKIIKVECSKLKALASGVESAVALWQDGIDSNPFGQRPDAMLLEIAACVKQWIENGCENLSQSKE